MILCNPLILRHPLSFCIRVFSSFPASGFFPVNQMFASRGQSIGASPSASVLPMDIQGWLPLGWTGLMCLQSKGNSVIQPCPLHHFWCYALMMTVGEKLGQGRKHTHTPVVSHFNFLTHCKTLSLSACMHAQSWLTLCDPMAHRFLCPWNFPSKNTGVDCHFLLQRNLPNPGIEPMSLASPVLAGRFFTTAPSGKPLSFHMLFLFLQISLET